MSTLLIIIVLTFGAMSLIRSRNMRKTIQVDKTLVGRKLAAERRLDKACEQTVILLKKVT